MPTYSTGAPIMLGDWVRVWSRSGVWHHGIVYRMTFTMMGAVSAEVANNLKVGGITLSDWDQFSDGRLVFLVQRASSRAHVQQIMERVESSLGKHYNLVAQNCEHFASFAFNGKAESKSMQMVGLVAAGAVIVKLLASKNVAA
jgi:hypothetical protein